MKFDMSQAWRDTVAMIGANREVMLIVAGVFFFLPTIVAVLLIPTMQPPVGASPEETGTFLLEFYSENGLTFFVMGIFQAIGFLSLLSLLRDDNQPTVGDAIRSGAAALLPYIATQVLMAVALALILGVLIGLSTALGAVGAILMVLAVPALIYVMIKLTLVAPVIAIEKIRNPIAAMKRSWNLTKGNSIRLMGFFMLLILAFLVVMVIISLVFGLIFALLGTGTAFLIANGIFSGVLGAIATMFFVAVLAAVHRQLAGPSTGNLSETFK